MYRFRSFPSPAGHRVKRETPQAVRRGAGFFTIVKITILFAPRGKQASAAERNVQVSITKKQQAFSY